MQIDSAISEWNSGADEVSFYAGMKTDGIQKPEASSEVANIYC